MISPIPILERLKYSTKSGHDVVLSSLDANAVINITADARQSNIESRRRVRAANQLWFLWLSLGLVVGITIGHLGTSSTAGSRVPQASETRY